MDDVSLSDVSPDHRLHILDDVLVLAAVLRDVLLLPYLLHRSLSGAPPTDIRQTEPGVCQAVSVCLAHVVMHLAIYGCPDDLVHSAILSLIPVHVDGLNGVTVRGSVVLAHDYWVDVVHIVWVYGVVRGHMTSPAGMTPSVNAEPVQGLGCVKVKPMPVGANGALGSGRNPHATGALHL